MSAPQEYEHVSRDLPAHAKLLLAQADTIAESDHAKALRSQKRAQRAVAAAERALEDAREALGRESAYVALAAQKADAVVNHARRTVLEILGIERKLEDVQFSAKDGAWASVTYKVPKLTEAERKAKAESEKRLAEETARSLAEKGEANKKNGAATAAAK